MAALELKKGSLHFLRPTFVLFLCAPKLARGIVQTAGRQGRTIQKEYHHGEAVRWV